jgi:hypothetical protein
MRVTLTLVSVGGKRASRIYDANIKVGLLVQQLQQNVRLLRTRRLAVVLRYPHRHFPSFRRPRLRERAHSAPRRSLHNLRN